MNDNEREHEMEEKMEQGEEMANGIEEKLDEMGQGIDDFGERMEQNFDNQLEKAEGLEGKLMEKFGIDPNDYGISPEMMDNMHILNIAGGAIMLAIGGLLLFLSRKQKTSSGKKIAGWILAGLGALAIITHFVQMLL